MGNVLEGYGNYINMEKYGKYQSLHMLDLIKCTDFFDIYDTWVKSGKKYRSPRLFRNVWKLWSSRWSPPFPQRDLVPLFQVNRLKSTTLAKNLTRQDNGSRKHGDHGESCELHFKKWELPPFNRSSLHVFFFGKAKISPAFAADFGVAVICFSYTRAACSAPRPFPST